MAPIQKPLEKISDHKYLFILYPLVPLYPYPVWGSPYQSADHYWPMYNITDGFLEDVEGAAHTVVYNGGKTIEVPQLGYALVFDGKDDWVDTGEHIKCLAVFCHLSLEK